MITLKILNQSEFFKEVYGQGGSPNDATVFDRIRYLSSYDFHFSQNDIEPYYTVLKDNEKIIGVCKIGNYPNSHSSSDSVLYSISFFTIDKNYRNKGYTRLIADELFKFVKTNNYSIDTSAYSYVGFLKLRHILNEYAIKHQVNFIDKKDDDSLHDGLWMYDENLNHINE